jgi:RING finger protein 113A
METSHFAQSTRSAAPEATRTNNATVAMAPKKVLSEKEKAKPKFLRTGPQAPGAAHLRASTTIDYAPDICKDYKETGFCGYGDSCKFMHDRGDYKAGWQIERDYQAQLVLDRAAAMVAKKAEEDEDANPVDIELRKQLDTLPWACLKCRQPFTRPVKTLCGHYFCEACALAHYRTSTKCQACGEQTQGIFDTAKKLAAMIKKRDELGLSDPDKDKDKEGDDDAAGDTAASRGTIS